MRETGTAFLVSLVLCATATEVAIDKDLVSCSPKDFFDDARSYHDSEDKFTPSVGFGRTPRQTSEKAVQLTGVSVSSREDTVASDAHIEGHTIPRTSEDLSVTPASTPSVEERTRGADAPTPKSLGSTETEFTEPYSVGSVIGGQQLAHGVLSKVEPAEKRANTRKADRMGEEASIESSPGTGTNPASKSALDYGPGDATETPRVKRNSGEVSTFKPKERILETMGTGANELEPGKTSTESAQSGSGIASNDSDNPRKSLPALESQSHHENSIFLEYLKLLMSVIPDSLQKVLISYEAGGVSSHSLVLTYVCGFIGSFLLFFLSCLSMSSKEVFLSDHITRIEQQLFALKKEREILLEEKLLSIDSGIVAGSREPNVQEEELDRLNIAIEHLRLALEESSSENDKSASIRAELMGDVERLTRIIEERDAQIRDLQQANETIVSELNERSSKPNDASLADSVDEIAVKHGETLESEVMPDGSAMRITEITANAERLEKALEESRDEIRVYSGRLKEIEKSRDEAKLQLSDTKQKLAVLSKYFEDREFQLQRDILKHESLWQKNEHDALSVVKELEFFKDQNEILMSKIAALKDEYHKSESALKRQVLDQEKKSHENWMAFKNCSKKNEDLQVELQLGRKQLLCLQAERESRSSLPERMKPLPPLPLPKQASTKSIHMPPPIPLPVTPSRSEENFR